MTTLIDSLKPNALGSIEVGSPEWIEWLSNPELKAFRFKCSYRWHIQAGIVETKDATCTVIKQGKYWNAQKRVSGRLRRYYLGAADKLTYDSLCEAATTLTVDPKWCDYLRRAKQSPGVQSHKEEADTCETEHQATSQTRNEIELQARIAELEKENAQLKGRISYLLDERGLGQAKANDDARIEIERLQKFNAELEEENIQLNRVYSQSEDINRKYLRRATEAESRIGQLERLNSELQAANQTIEKQLTECSQQEKDSVTQSSQPDSAAILNRLRKEHKKSKADLKDIELIAELLRANII